MKTIFFPWQAWYGDKRKAFEIPEGWRLYLAPEPQGKPLRREQVRRALLEPVGSKPLLVLAGASTNAAVLIDDLTRPTPTMRILPLVLDQLLKAGISKDKITLLFAGGAHRPMTKLDMIRKAGSCIEGCGRLLSHDARSTNMVDLGFSEAGTPISLSPYYVESDLRIGISSVMPHFQAGWGGGAKIVVPGVAGVKTIKANHGILNIMDGARERVELSLLKLDANPMRFDIESIVRRVGLDFSIEAVVDGSRNLVGVHAGDFVRSHRSAVVQATALYRTASPSSADIGLFSAYPKDTEFVQILNATNAWLSSPQPLVRKGGSIVLMTAGSEGIGFHARGFPGQRNFRPSNRWIESKVPDRRLLIYCPNVTTQEAHLLFEEGTIFFSNDWSEILARLRHRHGEDARVVAFPSSPIQIAEDILKHWPENLK